MNSAINKRRFYFGAFSVTLIFGTVLISYFENKSLSEAFYFCIVTMSTVGYGDITPMTIGGRLVSVFVIFVGVATFLSFVGNLTEITINNRERQLKKQKTNILRSLYLKNIGQYFLENAHLVIANFSDIREILNVKPDWTLRDFSQAKISIKAIDIEAFYNDEFFNALSVGAHERQESISRLLENPYVLDTEHFADLLLASLHLLDEVAARPDGVELPESDKKHLAGDAKRVFENLFYQWLKYMVHLKKQYPYLYSLALRTNPFDSECSSIVK